MKSPLVLTLIAGLIQWYCQVRVHAFEGVEGALEEIGREILERIASTWGQEPDAHMLKMDYNLEDIWNTDAGKYLDKNKELVHGFCQTIYSLCTGTKFTTENAEHRRIIYKCKACEYDGAYSEPITIQYDEEGTKRKRGGSPGGGGTSSKTGESSKKGKSSKV